MAQRFLVVVEWTGQGYSAYLPDIPGCIAVSRTATEAITTIRELLTVFLDTLPTAQRAALVPAATFTLIDVDV